MDNEIQFLYNKREGKKAATVLVAFFLTYKRVNIKLKPRARRENARLRKNVRLHIPL